MSDVSPERFKELEREVAFNKAEAAKVVKQLDGQSRLIGIVRKALGKLTAPGSAPAEPTPRPSVSVAHELDQRAAACDRRDKLHALQVAVLANGVSGPMCGNIAKVILVEQESNLAVCEPAGGGERQVVFQNGAEALPLGDWITQYRESQEGGDLFSVCAFGPVTISPPAPAGKPIVGQKQLDQGQVTLEQVANSEVAFHPEGASASNEERPSGTRVAPFPEA